MPAIQEYGLGFLFSSDWNPVEGREKYGALPMIYGTLVSSAIALLLSNTPWSRNGCLFERRFSALISSDTVGIPGGAFSGYP
jgi:ABC-type phosphate transport system permease subunit